MTQATQSTCIICAKPYSATQKVHITDLMTKEAIPIKSYPSTCLTCIMAELSAEKSQYLPNLKSAATELKIARIAYQKATNKHNKISAKYTHYDRQSAYIQFFISQEQATARKQQTSSKPSKASQAKQAKQADIIATLLASLTPAQQKLVLSKATEQKEAQTEV